ncbi:hypothetical protein FPOAC2_04902 [Fusarium poae]|uniref:Uncharacterized protein n=1 Tax=Fusarium poae TaxID=36050 RepID=A0A1B8ATF0_FUSPO|nr:hypothetical protein FPOAC1_004806 [Fusarium poae]KAG8671556.1 hypothetical protein FPOAC1_004806 [Fusarium poae]OBS23803.1 hypothetical protein FPOA_04351 [Fusarium poae]
MANGIAVVDDWISAPDPRISQQPYYTSYPLPAGYCQLYNPATVVWETETLSSWSEWSCDRDSPCCECDCNCRPKIKDMNLGDQRERREYNKRDLPGTTNARNYGATRELLPSLNVGGKPNAQHYMRQFSDREALQYDKQDLSSMEDLIYQTAKQQRHLDDARRRIQDWIKIMPGLVSDNTAQETEQRTEKCHCKGCKKERKQEARSAGKEKKHKQKQEAEKKNRRKTRR